MVEKWMVVATVVTLILVLVAGLLGYGIATEKKKRSTQGPLVSIVIPTVTPVDDIEPITEPIVTSPLPEVMLQLLSLREGQAATFRVGSTRGLIVKGCYDKWSVVTDGGAGSKTYETWGDLTVPLYKLALNAPQFAVSIHGKTFQVTNVAPRGVMQSAMGESFDLDAQNHPPIYSGIGALGQTE